MTIKDVLVHLGADASSKRPLDAAVALARSFDAHLAGLFVARRPALGGYMYPAPTKGLLDEHRKIVAAEAAKAKSLFESVVQRDAVHGEFRESMGNET